MATVKAVERGYFGGKIRRVGDVFECPEKSISKRWMEKVKGRKKEVVKEPPQVKSYNIPSMEGVEDFYAE